MQNQEKREKKWETYIWCTWGYCTWGNANHRKQTKWMRSIRPGILHLGQSNPRKEKKGHEKYGPGANATQGNANKGKYNNEKHAPGATAPWAIQTTERKNEKHATGATAPGAIWSPRKRRNEKHAPGATAPGAFWSPRNEQKTKQNWEPWTQGYCTWGNKRQRRWTNAKYAPGVLPLGQFNLKKNKQRNEKHALGATEPGAIEDKA